VYDSKDMRVRGSLIWSPILDKNISVQTCRTEFRWNRSRSVDVVTWGRDETERRFNFFLETRVLGIIKPDHSPPSSAEVKNAWSYTSTLPYVFTW